MELETELKETFLSKKKNEYGILVSTVFLISSLILSQLYWNPSLGLSEYLLASPVRVYDNSEYWRLFTSAFIHADLAHFLSNSLFLGLMGYFVSSYFGWVTFPIVAILMGAVINFIIVTSSIGDVGILGASGIVYWLWGFWLMMYFLIERKVTVTRRIMKIVAISLMVLVPTSYNPQTSYFAHFLGLILGLAIGTTHFFFNKKHFRSYERYEIIATEIDESWTNEDEEDNPPLYYH